MKKRIISLVLCLAMGLSIISTGVFAEEETTLTEEDVIAAEEMPDEETPAAEEETEESAAEAAEITEAGIVPEPEDTGDTFDQPVPYLEYVDGAFVERSALTYKNLDSWSYEIYEPGIMYIGGGTYVLSGRRTIDYRAVFEGDTSLILVNGCDITFADGIGLHEGVTLKIYAQSLDEDEMGSLTAESKNAAGIGGDYNSGYFHEDGDVTCGNIYIHGGKVKATGGCVGAGIGGGGGDVSSSDDSGDGGSVWIYGGVVEATGADFAAGIGGAGGNPFGTAECGNGGNVRVYGGKVTATGGIYAAGIGGGTIARSSETGDEGKGGLFEIYGGTVVAKAGGIEEGSGDYGGAGIGGARWRAGGTVNIYGGSLTAQGSVEGQAIGKGGHAKDESNGSIKVGFDKKEYRLKDNDTGAFVNVLNNGADLIGPNYVSVSVVKREATPYCAFNTDTGKFETKEITISDFTLIDSNTTKLTSGWYVMEGKCTIDKEVVADGEVNLILENGCELAITKGLIVSDGNYLSIYGQPEGGEPTGKLNASVNRLITDKLGTAGIGGSGSNGIYTADCGVIDIHGGVITAKGDKYSPGIGGAGVNYGASAGHGGSIGLYGGTVTAIGGELSPHAIGCGKGGVEDLRIGAQGSVFVWERAHVIDNKTGEEIIPDPDDLDIGRAYTKNWIGVSELREKEVSVSILPPWPAVSYETGETDEHGEPITALCEDYDFVTDGQTAWKDGWYVLNEDVTIEGALEVKGDVSLILMHDCKLTVNKNIHVGAGSSLSIYQAFDGSGHQPMLPGELEANKEARVSSAAGIGGFGDVNIYGGKITAYGGEQGAGIGGSLEMKDNKAVEYSGVVKIYGGEVNAYGGTQAAGIGGGWGGKGTVEIYGGDVTAVGGEGGGAGIGGGYNGNGDVLISGGIVTATGGDGRSSWIMTSPAGAGIGNGGDGKEGKVTITGEEVHAYGGKGTSAKNPDADAISAAEIIALPADGFGIKVYTDKDEKVLIGKYTEETVIGNAVKGKNEIHVETLMKEAMSGEDEDPTQPEPTTYAVSFNMNGHGKQIAYQTVEEGEKAERPKNPTANGYTFKGWYTDAKCTKAYDFDTAVTGDLTLYAKWVKYDPSVPATGDDTQIAFYAAVVLAAGAALTGMLVSERKKKAR